MATPPESNLTQPPAISQKTGPSQKAAPVWSARDLLRSQPHRRNATPSITPTDGELLMLFTRHQDEEALTRIIERHGPMVWRVCRGVLLHQQDAEDSYQATFLILARNARSIRAGESIAGWLYRVAHRTAISARRRSIKRREETLAQEPPAPPEKEFPDLIGRQMVGLLLEELHRLPAKYQTPLVMRYLEGRSRRAIAEATDTTIATVQGQLARGKKLLRSRLVRRGVSLSAAMLIVSGSTRTEAAPVHLITQTTADMSALALGSGSLAASATVLTLYREGARMMFLATLTKPALATTGVLLMALLATPLLAGDNEGAATTPIAAAPTLLLDATVTEPAIEAPAPMPLLIAQADGAVAETGATAGLPSSAAVEAKPQPQAEPEVVLDFEKLRSKFHNSLRHTHTKMELAMRINILLSRLPEGFERKSLQEKLDQLKKEVQDWTNSEAPGMISRLLQSAERTDGGKPASDSVKSDYFTDLRLDLDNYNALKVLIEQELESPPEVTVDSPSPAVAETRSVFAPKRPTPENGEEIESWPNGKVKAERIYGNGRLVEAIEYSEEGTVLYEMADAGPEGEAKSVVEVSRYQARSLEETKIEKNILLLLKAIKGARVAVRVELASEQIKEAHASVVIPHSYVAAIARYEEGENPSDEALQRTEQALKVEIENIVEPLLSSAKKGVDAYKQVRVAFIHDQPEATKSSGVAVADTPAATPDLQKESPVLAADDKLILSIWGRTVPSLYGGHKLDQNGTLDLGPPGIEGMKVGFGKVKGLAGKTFAEAEQLVAEQVRRVSGDSSARVGLMYRHAPASEATAPAPRLDKPAVPPNAHGKGRWRVIHRPSNLNPDGWATIAEVKVGYTAPIMLTDDQRPRPHLRIVEDGKAGCSFLVEYPLGSRGQEIYSLHVNVPRIDEIAGQKVQTIWLAGSRDKPALILVRHITGTGVASIPNNLEKLARQILDNPGVTVPRPSPPTYNLVPGEITAEDKPAVPLSYVPPAADDILITVENLIRFADEQVQMLEQSSLITPRGPALEKAFREVDLSHLNEQELARMKDTILRLSAADMMKSRFDGYIEVANRFVGRWMMILDSDLDDSVRFPEEPGHLVYSEEAKRKAKPYHDQIKALENRVVEATSGLPPQETIEAIKEDLTSRGIANWGRRSRKGFPDRNADYGYSVKLLQKALNKQLDPSPHLSIDGDYGPMTKAAIRRFQKQAGIKVNGDAGPETRNVLGLTDPPVDQVK